MNFILFDIKSTLDIKEFHFMRSYIGIVFLFSTIVAIGGIVFGFVEALISGMVKYLIKEFGLRDIQLRTVISAPGFVWIAASLQDGWVSHDLKVKYSREGLIIRNERQ